MFVNHEFGPYYNSDSKILILGSIPSVKSRELGFYYMHPQNRFWKVLSAVFNETVPDTIELKKNFLKRHYIALWDVITSCDIIGSSDASIKNVRVNDIKGLIDKTNIKYVFVTGKKALSLYDKYCYFKTNVKAIYLPSTSPANQTIKYDDLLGKYRLVAQVLNKIG